MRAYAIKIDGAPSAFPVVAGSQIGAQWDSLPNGVNDPNAQDVEWSIDETEHAVPGSNECSAAGRASSFRALALSIAFNES